MPTAFTLAAPGIFGSRQNPGTFWQILQNLGLDGNMQWCFDAGDIASFATAADQTWVNRGVSSPARDLTLGIDTGASTDDPAFVGTPGGLTGGEYFLFDGGDFFRITSPASSAPAWVQSLHQDNAVWALGMWVQLASLSSAQGLFGTFDGNTASRGVYVRVETSGQLRLWVGNGSGSYALAITSTAAIPTGRPVFVGVTLDEAAGTGTMQIGATQESFTSTYTSPTASNSSAPIRVGSNTGTGSRILSGGRLHGLWLRSGTATSAADMMAFYARSRQRFGF